MKEFDFAEWRKLAESDPEAFELRRKQALDAIIAVAPDHRQQRLRGLQWRVDMERGRHKDPVKSCKQVFNMMWQSVYAEQGLLATLNNLPGDGRSPVVEPSRARAQVLDFQVLSSDR